MIGRSHRATSLTIGPDLDHKQLKGAYRSREGIMYRFATTLFAGIVAAVLVSSVSVTGTLERPATRDLRVNECAAYLTPAASFLRTRPWCVEAFSGTKNA